MVTVLMVPVNLNGNPVVVIIHRRCTIAVDVEGLVEVEEGKAWWLPGNQT